MLKNIILVVAAVACGAAEARRGPRAGSPTAGKQLAKAVDAFGINFLMEVERSAPNKNLVTSPLSASAVFALLSLAASEQTHSEIIDVLKIHDDDFTRTAFNETTAALAVTEGVTLALANTLFVANVGITLAPAFLKDATEVFKAGVEPIDFSHGEQAANTINQYVEKATHDRIKDLISGDDLDTDTRLVIINAIYFKGKWLTQFNAKNTRERSFHVSPMQTVQVPTMASRSEYLYGENQQLGVQILELPYEKRAVSLIVVLPRSKNNLDKLLQQLATRAGETEITTTVRNLTPAQVHLRLPKFKIETKIDLKDIFIKLGAAQMFDPLLADLSKLATSKKRLYVEKAIQKAFVEVNEEGAEAAVASAAVIHGRSGRDYDDTPTVNFYADRPFLWLLRARDTHLTLFAGIYRGP